MSDDEKTSEHVPGVETNPGETSWLSRDMSAEHLQVLLDRLGPSDTMLLFQNGECRAVVLGVQEYERLKRAAGEQPSGHIYPLQPAAYIGSEKVTQAQLAAWKAGDAEWRSR